MAVFTALSFDEIEQILQDYSVGQLQEVVEIQGGVTNTLYKVGTEHADYVMTLLEELTPAQSEYFIALMDHLNQQGYPCPQLIKRNDGSSLGLMYGKPVLLQNFILGNQPTQITTKHCEVIGGALADLHLVTQSFELRQGNARGIDWINATALKVENCLPADEQDLLHRALADFENPIDVPKGLIHADLFIDNTLFHNDELCAVIDYFYACHDDYLLDLATVINDWCWQAEFDPRLFKTLVNAYQVKRQLTSEEIQYLPLYCRRAASRFWLSRLKDWYFPAAAKQVMTKNPHEFRVKLLFYMNNEQLLSYQSS